MMGCSAGDKECLDPEEPAHRVRTTKAFETGRYEVTQAQWQSVMGSNPSFFKGSSLPVESTGWNDVQDSLQKLNAKQDGYRYGCALICWQSPRKTWRTTWADAHLLRRPSLNRHFRGDHVRAAVLRGFRGPDPGNRSTLGRYTGTIRPRLLFGPYNQQLESYTRHPSRRLRHHRGDR